FIENIKNPPSEDEVLYTGCNTLVIAQILNSRMFEGLGMFGSFDLCCGEMYYRMGIFDTAREAALRLKEAFAPLRGKTVVFVCAACMNMITNIYPAEFGIDFGINGVFVSEWIMDKIHTGRTKIRNPIRKKITIQDSCHSKMLGAAFTESPRELLSAAGCRISEMKMTKAESLCCGIAAGCAKFGLTDIAGASMNRLLDTWKTGTDMTAAYCHGCLLSMSMVRWFMPWTPPVHPMIQIVQAATGENPDFGLSMRRAGSMLFGIATATGPSLFSGSRFFLDSICRDCC
ncbi:MAG TPA: (Fe-S)-binding protein, partial [bacterium]|nr:(Fe-S)-binding protein [bacterium]